MKDRKQYYKEYREKNKEKIAAGKKERYQKNKGKKRVRDGEQQKEYNKRYYEANKELRAEKDKEYREKNNVKIAKRHKEWRDKNKEKVRENSRKYHADRRQSDPAFKVLSNMRSRIHYALAEQDTVKDSTTLKLTGCSKDKLISHIEAQFTEGMTWENYSLHGWHLDHIRPCSSFDLTLDSQQRECFHYTNLQPLWAEDNWKKGNKYNEIQP
jgi:hypothetical protein